LLAVGVVEVGGIMLVLQDKVVAEVVQVEYLLLLSTLLILGLLTP
jgi:hypothetical protein